MNIFKREMKANRRALIIWCVCIFILVVAGMGKYTAYSGDSANMELFNNMPYAIKALLGIGPFDVTKMAGYFALLFVYTELIIGIHAVLLGSGILSKEERDKTTEFLMVMPVSRNAIVTSKLLASLVNLLVVNVVSLLSSIVMVNAYNKGAPITGEILSFHLSLFLVQLIFFSVGFLIAACIKNSKASGSLSAAILICSFMIAKVTDLSGNMNFLNILSPFKYFSYVDIVNGNGLNAVVMLLSVLLTAACVYGTYYFYRNRDLAI